jgi:hypothetical protein
MRTKLVAYLAMLDLLAEKTPSLNGPWPQFKLLLS